MSPNKQLPKSTIGPIKSTINKDLSKKVGGIGATKKGTRGGPGPPYKEQKLGK